MRISRRTFGWIAILGLVIALVVILQRRGDGPAVAEGAGSTLQSNADARTTRRVATAADSAESIADSGDQAVEKCAQTLNDAADFVSKERDAAQVQAAEPSEAQVLAELGKAQRSLAGSGDPEYFLASMLLGPLVERQASNDATAQTKLLDLGDRAVRSGSKLLAWHALSACVAAKQSCPLAHLEQRLLEADGQNAEAWAMVATLKYERGDAAGALAAMQGAARAPISTSYWTETISLIERSLAAQTTMPYQHREWAAFGAGASVALPVTNPLKMCKVESASSRAWGDACLAFGMLRGKRNETLLAKLIAYSIREQVLTARGDREGAAEVAAERALVGAEQRAMAEEPARSMQRLQSALIDTDLERVNAYLGAVQQYGELAGARMFLRQEVPPLLERAGLLEREGTRECAAQLFVGYRPATAGQQAQMGDELYITMRSATEGWSRTLRVGPDGKVTLPFFPGAKAAGGKAAQPEREIAVAGKTTGQLQREIATMLSPYLQSPDVVVVLLSRRSDEELRLEFDNARKDAAERRGKPH